MAGSLLPSPSAGLPAEALAKAGGPKRDRTADLLNAIEALFQLSYGPGEEGQIPTWPNDGKEFFNGYWRPC